MARAGPIGLVALQGLVCDALASVLSLRHPVPAGHGPVVGGALLLPEIAVGNPKLGRGGHGRAGVAEVGPDIAADDH